MSKGSDTIPNPKELEKEISDFLAKRFGGNVKVVSPVVVPKEKPVDAPPPNDALPPKINFDIKPEELIAHLDQYIVKQAAAKAVLSTKICTHFNRIRHALEHPESDDHLVGQIKNNVLMIGPTGVGKTYMIKLIAGKLGVPFVKGDATKFSETGYVGGDVEDLIRDLVREADDDLELAQYGIVYIDEIDKIASSRNLVGADVSRTGVQRALLKPMEETEVDLKVPHDPISMIQEIEQFRKSGNRAKRTVNTRNILFIMSGAFGELGDIIHRRLTDSTIGFGAQIRADRERTRILNHVATADLIRYGFESEFVGRLPVRAVFDELQEADLLEILENPNNPIVLGKKNDFAAYGIGIKFDRPVLAELARRAYRENTGARGLVSAVEHALLPFETHLPSTAVRWFPVTIDSLADGAAAMAMLEDPDRQTVVDARFDDLAEKERAHIRSYLKTQAAPLARRVNLTLTPSKIALAAELYARRASDITQLLGRIKTQHDEVKDLELDFFKRHDLNVVFEEDAIDFILEQRMLFDIDLETFSHGFESKFTLGLKLVRDKTGKNRFFLNRAALDTPEEYINNLIKMEMGGH
jgi:ATP-dependent Clp protease ATP-binding subunit ClpX